LEKEPETLVQKYDHKQSKQEGLRQEVQSALVQQNQDAPV